VRPDLFSTSAPIPDDACGSEPEADAGEEGGATPPRSPPSGAKRGRSRWSDEAEGPDRAEGTGGAGPSGLAASDPSGCGDQILSSQEGLKETLNMSTEQANAAFDEYDQKQESEATQGLSEMDLGDGVGAARSTGPVMY
jgi:hypothetical protein